MVERLEKFDESPSWEIDGEKYLVDPKARVPNEEERTNRDAEAYDREEDSGCRIVLLGGQTHTGDGIFEQYKPDFVHARN